MSSVSYLPVNVNHANGYIYENVLQNKFLLKMNRNYFELSSGDPARKLCTSKNIAT